MREDYFTIAVKNIKKRKLRSALTLIGIFLAITTIFVLLSLSLGLEDAVGEQFRLLGTDKIFIMPGGSMESGGISTTTILTKEDVKIIERISGVKAVAWMVAGTTKVEFKDTVKFTYLIGLAEDSIDLYIEGGSLKLDEGRLLRRSDKKAIMIGSQYKKNKFLGKEVELGDTLLLNNEQYKVKAIFQSVGSPQDDRQIYMSADEFNELMNVTDDRVDYIIVQSDDGEDIDKLSSLIEKKLMNHRNVDKKTKDFSIMTPTDIMETFNQVLGILTAFLVGIGAISLLVGGIGVANTMYTSVVERTREIGVMKAIGAKNEDIRDLFLVESGMLGLVGGIVGVLLGILIGKIIEYIISSQLGVGFMQVAVNPLLVMSCLTFAFAVGALSGMLPALQASKVKPVKALRYE